MCSEAAPLNSLELNRIAIAPQKLLFHSVKFPKSNHLDNLKTPSEMPRWVRTGHELRTRWKVSNRLLVRGRR